MAETPASGRPALGVLTVAERAVTRTGLWVTRGEVGHCPCQARHGAKVPGGAIRALARLRTAPMTSRT